MNNLKQMPSFSDPPDPLPLKRSAANRLSFPRSGERNKGTDLWLITLSDLLMLLVIFFVILFGMEAQKSAPRLSVPPPPRGDQSGSKTQIAGTPSSSTSPSASIEKDLAALLSRDQGARELTVSRADNAVTLTFPEGIIFDPGYARLKPSAQSTLGRVARFIQERSSLFAEVQGHTDDRPIKSRRYPSNWELSVDRATQVAKTLIGLGVNPSRLSVKGFGEYHPLYPNDSDEHRLKNRRVEIQFLLPVR